MDVDQSKFIFFNFFARVQKPPEQPDILTGFQYVFEYVRSQPSFVLGQLHQNLDPSGPYKFVNQVGFNDGDFDIFQPGPPSPKWMEILTKGMGPRGTQETLASGFQELASLSGKALWTNAPKGDNSFYLLLNYKHADIGAANCSAFEADWKNKFGVNALLDGGTFPADVKLGDIALYKSRRSTISPFEYVVRCEVVPGPSAETLLASLDGARAKLKGAGIPFNDLAAYKVAHVGTPM